MDVTAGRDRQPHNGCSAGRESAAVADQIIGQIEERFPNWQSFRDLIDCIDVTLHQLRGARTPTEPQTAPQIVTAAKNAVKAFKTPNSDRFYGTMKELESALALSRPEQK